MTKNKFLLFLPAAANTGDVYGRELRRLFPEMDIISVFTAEEAAKHMPETEQMMTIGQLMNQGLFDAGKNLKWMHLLTSGIDGLDRFNIRKDVLITSGRGGPMYPVAEAGMAMMFAITRHFQQVSKNQVAHDWSRREVPQLLRGKTAVICGVGLIAETLAPMLKAFRMPVEGLSSRSDTPPGFDRILPMSELKAAASRADYFIILTPLTEKSRGLINREILGAMKPGVFLINLARGALVDEDALIEALRDKKIRGAALDVFTTEPLPKESPLWDLPNVFVTPHSAGQHESLWEDIVPICARNLKAWNAGKTDEMINKVAR